MRWLRKKVYNWLNQDQYLKEADIAPSRKMYSNSRMNISIYPAVGGWIVEYSNENDIKTNQIGHGNNKHNLHIITSDQDLGKSIDKIITYELLSR